MIGRGRYLEYVGPKADRKEKVIIQWGKTFVFKANPEFGNRWVTHVNDEQVAKYLAGCPTAFQLVFEGEALLLDKDFVRVVLENEEIVRHIFDSRAEYEADAPKNTYRKPPPPKPEPISYDDLSWAQLREMGEKAGLLMPRGTTRPALIEALKGVSE